MHVHVSICVSYPFYNAACVVNTNICFPIHMPIVQKEFKAVGGFSLFFF